MAAPYKEKLVAGFLPARDDDGDHTLVVVRYDENRNQFQIRAAYQEAILARIVDHLKKDFRREIADQTLEGTFADLPEVDTQVYLLRKRIDTAWVKSYMKLRSAKDILGDVLNQEGDTSNMISANKIRGGLDSEMKAAIANGKGDLFDCLAIAVAMAERWHGGDHGEGNGEPVEKYKYEGCLRNY